VAGGGLFCPVLPASPFLKRPPNTHHSPRFSNSALLSHICSQHRLIRFLHPPALHPGSNLVKPDGQNGAFLTPWPPPTTHCLTQPPLPCACSDLRCLHALWRMAAPTAPTTPPRFELFAFGVQAAMQCARSVLIPARRAACRAACRPTKLHSLFLPRCLFQTVYLSLFPAHQRAPVCFECVTAASRHPFF